MPTDYMLLKDLQFRSMGSINWYYNDLEKYFIKYNCLKVEDRNYLLKIFKYKESLK